MSEYKLVVIQTDGGTDVQDKYNGLEFSAITGIQEAVEEANALNKNIYTCIQQEGDEESSLTS